MEGAENTHFEADYARIQMVASGGEFYFVINFPVINFRLYVKGDLVR